MDDELSTCVGVLEEKECLMAVWCCGDEEEEEEEEEKEDEEEREDFALFLSARLIRHTHSTRRLAC